MIVRPKGDIPLVRGIPAHHTEIARLFNMKNLIHHREFTPLYRRTSASKNATDKPATGVTT